MASDRPGWKGAKAWSGRDILKCKWAIKRKAKMKMWRREEEAVWGQSWGNMKSLKMEFIFLQDRSWREKEKQHQKEEEASWDPYWMNTKCWQRRARKKVNLSRSKPKPAIMMESARAQKGWLNPILYIYILYIKWTLLILNFIEVDSIRSQRRVPSSLLSTRQQQEIKLQKA